LLMNENAIVGCEFHAAGMTLLPTR
jgi:hypothetical protein